MKEESGWLTPVDTSGGEKMKEVGFRRSRATKKVCRDVSFAAEYVGGRDVPAICRQLRSIQPMISRASLHLARSTVICLTIPRVLRLSAKSTPNFTQHYPSLLMHTIVIFFKYKVHSLFAVNISSISFSNLFCAIGLVAIALV